MINTLIFALFLITENLAIWSLLEDSTTVKTLKDYFTYDHGFLIALNIIQIIIFLSIISIECILCTQKCT